MQPAYTRLALRRGQQALRESEVRYEALVENSVTSIYLSDGERILYCNSKFAEVFGESRPAMAGNASCKFKGLSGHAQRADQTRRHH